MMLWKRVGDEYESVSSEKRIEEAKDDGVKDPSGESLVKKFRSGNGDGRATRNEQR